MATFVDIDSPKVTDNGLVGRWTATAPVTHDEVLKCIKSTFGFATGWEVMGTDDCTGTFTITTRLDSHYHCKITLR